MIYCIKRKDLDIDKYDACIAASVQFRIYAFSWYLDAVSENWEVLILNDYEAVMPLPWKQKYFLKYITQPFFCQQLGIFSFAPITLQIQENMIRRIPKKFMRTSINFNADNFLNANMKLRKNALLTIENVYENMHAKFNKNRKRALKKASSLGFTFQENIAANEFYDFYVLNDKNHRTHVSMKKVLQNILNLKTQAVQCYGIKRNTVLIAGVLLLVDPKRITYLIPVASAFGKKNAAATLLVDEIIKKYRHSHQILDFEGSMISGVAKFYESFGTTYEDYPTFSKNFI